MDIGDLVGEQEILSEALVFCGDTDLKKGLTLGFYKGQIQRCIEELALDTFYQTLTIDLPVPKNLQDDVPTNCFNIREFYLWSGTCCQPQNSVIVHYKNRFNNNSKGGTNYTALRSDLDTAQDSDPFYEPYLNAINYWAGPFAIYFANIQNGKIMFSRNAVNYPMYRLVYNGFGGNIGDPPIAPRMFRGALVDYVVAAALRAFMAREPRTYSVLYREASEKLNNPYNGSWREAKKRMLMMSSFQRRELSEYLSHGNW